MTNAAMTTITLGDRIRVAINRSGLTLEEVGAAVGVTSKTVGRWQSDDTVPKFDHLVRLAHLTGYDVRFFADAVATLSDRGPTTRYLLSIVPPVTGQLHLDFAPDAPDPTRSVELLAAVA